MKIAIGILAVALSAHAQSAHVVALSPTEAAEAKSIHDQMEALIAKSHAFDDHIRAKYLKAGPEDEGHTQYYGWDDAKRNTGYWVKFGWGNGQFEYSTDFKYIVPYVLPYVSPPVSSRPNFIGPALGTLTMPIGGE